MNTPFLIFSMHFDRDKGLDYGRLGLWSDKGCLKIWTATSSYATKQYSENFHERGGMLPPPYRCKNLPFYTVATKPIPLPNVKGVEGNFYKINPHQITTDKGGIRGDFGIHRDANVPGSFGCLVMNSERFQDFENEMKKLSNFSTIPLFVQYS